VDEVVLRQVLLPVIRFSVTINPPVLHTYLHLNLPQSNVFESSGSTGTKSDFTLSVQSGVRQKAYKNINRCSSLTINWTSNYKQVFMSLRPVLLRGITLIAALYQTRNPALLLRGFTFIAIWLSQVILNVPKVKGYRCLVIRLAIKFKISQAAMLPSGIRDEPRSQSGCPILWPQ
jgi:hypothetical protein